MLTTLGDADGDGTAEWDGDAAAVGEVDACRLAGCVLAGWADGVVPRAATVDVCPCGCAVGRPPVALTSAYAPPPTANSTTTAPTIHQDRLPLGSRSRDGRAGYEGPAGEAALGVSATAGAVGAMFMVGGDASSSAATPKSRPQPPQYRVLVVRARPHSGQKLMRIPYRSWFPITHDLVVMI